MRKFLISSAAALVLTTAANAHQGRGAHPIHKSHFYLGLNAGFQHARATFNNTFYSEAGPLTSGESAKTNSSNFLTGVSLGYAKYVRRVLIGFDINMDFQLGNKEIRKEMAHPRGSLTILLPSLRKKYDIHPGIVLGYAFNNSLVGFLKLGISFARFEKKFTNRTAGANNFGSKKDLWAKSFVPTIGLEWNASKRWAMLTSLSYAKYPVSHLTPQVNPAFGALVNTYHISARPRYITWKVGVKFKI